MMCTESRDAKAVNVVMAAAAVATAAAPTKAARRRVRQRLHKKLGPILSDQDLEEVIKSLKTVTDSGSSGEPVRTKHMQARPLAAGPVPPTCPAVPDRPEDPDLQLRATSDPTPLAAAQVAALAREATVTFEEIYENQQATYSGSNPFSCPSAGAIPVVRTFIHFTDEAPQRRRRSHSV
eukprot:gb/GFBE01032466.1/.p1 GENE.gb/GFBE01032466.1/~~gb/GFBE01032466.1/.p1  ORF type:complete len:179 (+),score=34.78 gb/GFBE01032466.1/:1-537(+)